MVVHGDPVFNCAKNPRVFFHPGFTPSSMQAVLHEVYPLGNSFVKAVKSEFALAKVCQAPGHWLVQLLVHLNFEVSFVNSFALYKILNYAC